MSTQFLPKSQSVSTFAVLTVVAAGCFQPDQIQSPADKDLVSHVAALTAPTPHVTYDDELEEIGNKVPGFGGFYYDENDSLVVRLKDVRHLNEARVALHDYFEAKDFQGIAHAQARLLRLSTLRAERAMWTFGELREHFKLVTQSVLGLPGVVFGDINEATNRILVGVVDEAERDAAEAVVASLPIPRGMVTYEVTGHAARLDANLQTTVRPVIAGHKIMSGTRVCTIGFNIYHVFPGDPYNVDPEEYLITASHCTPQWGGGPPTALTDTVGQASLGEQVAVLVADRIYLGTSVFPNCPPGRLCRYSDTAVYRYLPTVSWVHGYLPWPSLNSLDYTTTKIVYGDSYAGQGEAIYLLGQTSGLRAGSVSQTCTTVREANRPPLTGYHVNKSIICAFRGTYASNPGDSGGSVVKIIPDGTGRLASVGIHFQNDGIFPWFSGQSQWKTDTSNEIPGNWGTAVSRQ